MSRLPAVLLWLGLAGCVLAEAWAVPPEDAAAESFQQTLRPFVAKYCFDCHSGEAAEAELSLDSYKTPASMREDRPAWQRVLRMVRGREMPPEDMPQPTTAEVVTVTRWIEEEITRVDCSGPIDPGRVTIRRLNRVEYANTVRDLLGVAFDPGDRFPADDVGYGFDNIGDVLMLPPLLMEKYLDAAEEIAPRAIATDRKKTKPDDDPKARERILFVQPGEGVSEDDAARRVLRRLATGAFRRPVEDGDIERLMRLVRTARERGDGFEGSIRMALQAVLVSPRFLFRIEKDPQPNNAEAVRSLDEYELATRLSYFLWSTMPDVELFAQATAGTLRENLDAQVRRMLADRKSRELVENFAGQWLELRNLDTVTPDRKQFASFDEGLRRSMQIEAEMLFEAVMREDRSILDLIDADFTFVDGRLAKHYGLQGVEGDEFRRVQLKETPRGGVITLAGVLTVTSNPTRTSPVKRGKWILENVLGTPPPEPPPDVPMLAEDKNARLSGTLRERMEQHRADPNCAVCHRKMDAMGFALENFDAVGTWREKDGQFPIDPSGELPDGQKFQGAADLKKILRDSGRDDFARCLAEKMLTYALGRGLEPYDKCSVDRIVKQLAAEQYRLSALVLAIVHSDPFQKRTGKRE
jgi:hypothetical protein